MVVCVFFPFVYPFSCLLFRSSSQLFLVSNGGKFMKKTLIGEAYIWLDKVDMRKRAVSWHKLVATTSQTQP